MMQSEWKTLENYVGYCASVIGLKDWVIKIKDDPCDDDSAAAQVRIIYGRKLAIIRFCPAFRSMDREDQRNTVIHELIHCHLDLPGQMAHDDLGAIIAPGELALFQRQYTRAMELSVDALATAIEQFFPLIDWAEEGPAHGTITD